MGRDQKPPKRGICAYCGREDELTTDHVIPRCLFRVEDDALPGDVPGDVPKVRACAQCNGATKSADDIYLRDMLANDARTAQSLYSQALRRGPLMEPHKRSHQYFRDATRRHLTRTPSGLYMDGPMLPTNRLRDMFIRMVRGLMVAYEGYNLPRTTNFDVLRAVDARVALNEAQQLAASTSAMVHTVQVGDGSVFWCVYYHSQSEGHTSESMWWLRFYEHVVYWIGTDMSNLLISEF